MVRCFCNLFEGSVLVAAAAYLIYYTLVPHALLMGSVINGYTAKLHCSYTFVSRRTDNIFESDLAGIFKLVTVSQGHSSISASLWGTLPRTAVYHPGLGCTLTDPASNRSFELLPSFSSVAPGRTAAQAAQPWPLGNALDATATQRAQDRFRMHTVERAMDKAFREPNPEAAPKDRVNTRAVLVLHRGQIVAERYAPGFTADMRLAGWSMTKSITSALLGKRIAQGKLSLNDTLLPQEWIDAPQFSEAERVHRRSITIRHGLQMTDGLHFDEVYHPFLPKDPAVMLMHANSTARFAGLKPQWHPPGEHWYYSSGTTNLLQHKLRNSFASHTEYLSFVRAFLDAAGMYSAVLEPDATGTFVGSSFSHMTARDWARFGLLFLNVGKAPSGEELLPATWVRDSHEMIPENSVKNSRNNYGFQWWLGGRCDRGHSLAQDRGRARQMLSLPCDTYYAHGYEQNAVVVIPSLELVYVRLGVTKDRAKWDDDAFLHDIVLAMKK